MFYFDSHHPGRRARMIKQKERAFHAFFMNFGMAEAFLQFVKWEEVKSFADTSYSIITVLHPNSKHSDAVISKHGSRSNPPDIEVSVEVLLACEFADGKFKRSIYQTRIVELQQSTSSLK